MKTLTVSSVSTFQEELHERISQADCDRISYKLNTRPRKRHGFKTPYEVYYRTASPLHFALEPRRPFYPQFVTITI